MPYVLECSHGMRKKDARHDVHRAPLDQFIGATHLRRLGPCSGPCAVEEPPGWYPVVTLRLAYKCAGVIAKRAVNIVRESPERGDMAYGAGEEDAERGDTEAALCMLGGLATVGDADTAVRTIGEVVSGSRFGEEWRRDR
jgi:hypothetical protein